MDLFKEHGISIAELYEQIQHADELAKVELIDLAELIETICYEAGYTE